MTEVTIGVVGLGLMGSSITKRLLDLGYDVTGYDIREEVLQEATAAGATAGESAADVAFSVDLLITSLPTPEVVKDVYLGEDGVATGVDDSLVCLEMSTIDPDTSRRIAEEAEELEFLDAPVSGGPENCVDGSLMIIVGGNEATYKSDAVQGVLDALGSKVFHAGDVGAGHTVKLLNNVMSMGNLLLSMEMTALGVAAGVEPEVLNEILPNTGGASNQFRKRFPRVLNRNFDPGFTVDYAKKDIGLAMDTAEERNVPVIVGEIVHQLYTRASAEGLGNEDCCSVVKMFEESTGIPVEADEEVDETFEGYS